MLNVWVTLLYCLLLIYMFFLFFSVTLLFLQPGNGVWRLCCLGYLEATVDLNDIHSTRNVVLQLLEKKPIPYPNMYMYACILGATVTFVYELTGRRAEGIDRSRVFGECDLCF